MNRTRTTVGPSVDELPQRHAALLVLDVDEVVLHFVKPFQTLLHERGARFHFDSFALQGNIRSISTGAAVSGHEISGATRALYEEQEQRQTPVDGTREALERLREEADIVFLTAMTPTFHDRRRRLLDREGLPYPMIATERSKGSVVAELAERWAGPIVFVDDLPQNLEGVRRSCERADLVHLMADEGLRPHLPPLPRGALSARDWIEAEPLLLRLLTASAPMNRVVG